MSQIIDKYCRLTISSSHNFTITYLSERIEVSHDLINRELRRLKLTPRRIRKRSDRKDILIIDDTHLDKRHSRNIECANYLWDNCEKKVLMGIGLVNAVSVDEEGNFHLKDYRIYSKREDGKTKIQLAHEIVKKSESKIVLFDSWYASKDFMKFLNGEGKIFYSTLPFSRVFYDEQNKKHKLKDYEFTEEELKKGKLVQLNKMNFKVRIFRSCVKKGEAVIIVTNDITQSSLKEAEKMLSLRWSIEEFHREIKNVTGIEKCQARKSRIQRNHICCCLMAWQFLKAEARKRKLTVYSLHQSQSDNFIRSQLLKPKLKFA